MYKEQVMEERTYKGIEDELGIRVFRTLTHEAPVNAGLLEHRSAKLLGLLVEHLAQKGLISETEIDELLFQVAM